MSFRFLPDDPVASIKLRPGQTVMVDPSARRGGSCLEVLEGGSRVLPCEETKGMTLAFLQGKAIRCGPIVCAVRASALRRLPRAGFRSDAEPQEGVGLIRSMSGRCSCCASAISTAARPRCAFMPCWLCSLIVWDAVAANGVTSFRITHDRIGELIGSTRVHFNPPDLQAAQQRSARYPLGRQQSALERRSDRIGTGSLLMTTFNATSRLHQRVCWGNLCRQIAWVDGQCQLLHGMIQRCVDAQLLQRLQADLVEMKTRARVLDQLGRTAAMDQMSDQLSVAFYREVTRRTLNRFSHC